MACWAGGFLYYRGRDLVKLQHCNMACRFKSKDQLSLRYANRGRCLAR